MIHLISKMRIPLQFLAKIEQKGQDLPSPCNNQKEKQTKYEETTVFNHYTLGIKGQRSQTRETNEVNPIIARIYCLESESRYLSRKVSPNRAYRSARVNERKPRIHGGQDGKSSQREVSKRREQLKQSTPEIRRPPHTHLKSLAHYLSVQYLQDQEQKHPKRSEIEIPGAHKGP